MNATRWTRWLPGIMAWLATCAVPAAFDEWATTRCPQRPTQSRTLGHFLPNQIIGPVLFGVFCALGYHLFVEELVVVTVHRLKGQPD